MAFVVKPRGISKSLRDIGIITRCPAQSVENKKEYNINWRYLNVAGNYEDHGG